MRLRLAFALALLALAARGAGAQAAPPLPAPTITATGFTIAFATPIAAPPATVFEAMTTKVGTWWNPAHTWSGASANLAIDLRPGGCFCEALPTGGVEHLRVVFVRAPSLLRLAGNLGPMQGSGLASALTLEFKAAEGGTRLEVTYDVGGHIAMGYDKIAPLAQLMLAEQFGRLKAFVETGRPERGTR